MAANAKLTKTNDLGFFEIRLESIGGLGANLAGKMLAEAGVIRLGFNGSNFSAYGSEKKGSPVKSYVRFANPETSIRDSSPIEEPHVVAVFHEALFRTQNCSSGLKEDGVLIVNTKRTPDEIREQTGLQSGTIVCVDALGISVDEKTRINTAMLGTLCRIVDFLDPDAIRSMISDTFIKKYPALVESNIRTFDRGFEEVNVKTYELTEGQHVVPFVRPEPALGYLTQPMGGTVVNPGNSILKDLSASRQGFLPSFERDVCIHCAACDQVCPDYCFVWQPQTDAKGRQFQFLQGIDYQYCKGCLKCVEACPTDALKSLREDDGYADGHKVAQIFHLV